MFEAIVLAAGESRRMGYPKPLLRIDNTTFIERITSTILQVVPRVTVVIGAHAERVRPAVARDSRITIVENRNYRNGQLSSLKAALPAVSPECSAVLVHLGDHPLVRAATFLSVLDAARHQPAPIVIAR
ncbi:MAG TPA: nucleotidyltransferase family protein, partial [Candidatus Binataceae bacterium]